MADQAAKLSAAITLLHEALYVKSLLQSPKAADILPSTAGVSLKPTETWPRFLDELSQLCQFQKGAEGTTAIGAQQDDGEVIYWLATNTGPKLQLQGARDSQRNHLEMVLANLRSLNSREEWEKEVAESNASEIIFHRSVKKSTDKISNYQRRLNLFVSKADVQLKDFNEQEDSLMAGLKQLTREPEHEQLCRLADRFCALSSTNYDILKSKINGNTSDVSSEVWTEIRHFVGRLASIRKAANFVASQAPLFCSELEHFQVCLVPPQVTDHPIELGQDLKALLIRVCPRLQTDGLLDTIILKMERVKALREKVSESKESVIHAEAAIAHHFYVEGMKFAHDDYRYIGCSKPSCYCCDLYLAEHPGGFRRRQTSGNAYLKWFPPTGKGVDGVTLDTLRKMAFRINSEILSQAKNRKFVAKKQFDSTTGITPTVREIVVIR